MYAGTQGVWYAPKGVMIGSMAHAKIIGGG